MCLTKERKKIRSERGREREKRSEFARKMILKESSHAIFYGSVSLSLY